ncbi:hypothetical protein ScPMuIL_016600 [Solemya velum]
MILAVIQTELTDETDNIFCATQLSGFTATKEREKTDLWQVKQLLEQNEKNLEGTEEQSKHAQKQMVQLVEASKSLQQQIDNGEIDEDKYSGLRQEKQSQILQRVDAFKENNEDIWSNFFPSAVAHLPIKYPLTHNIVCHQGGSATRTFLAEGAFDAVYMGRLSETGETVVVKEFTNGRSSPNAILREAIALQRLYQTGFDVIKTAAGVAIVPKFFGDGTTLHSLLYGSSQPINVGWNVFLAHIRPSAGA